jgi:MFS family permease
MAASTPRILPTFVTSVPARLDRLPWSRFHTLLVMALGVTWILDGLEVTLMGAIAAVIQRPDVFGFSASQIGFISSSYLTGAVLGSLVFGHLTDRFGRRKFFFLTVFTYLAGVGLTAIAWNLTSFAAFRFITGAGIGGEYSAVNSAIDELIPARLRGRIDLIINGSFWLGAAMGSASTFIILNPRIIPYGLGWRLGFGIGAVIGVAIIYFRRFIPESPRWLLTHGRLREAEAIVRQIENDVVAMTGEQLVDPAAERSLTITPRHRFGLKAILKPIFGQYRSRSVLALSLMVAQAFAYNAIFFTYALVLNRFYGVAPETAGVCLLPFALSNFLGPVILGRYFDTIGRRQMIAGTFAMSALLLIMTGLMFSLGLLTALTQIVLWTVVFFFASPAASSAYLTVSEVFPQEIRALAIAVFYSAGTATGGIIAPWFFGKLIDTGTRPALFLGYAVAAALMLIAAVVEFTIGVPAEGMSLEQIAAPLSSAR